jgi:hypothetical protein
MLGWRLPPVSLRFLWSEYTVSATRPKGYKASTPSTQKFIWKAESTALAPIVLKYGGSPAR